MGIFDLNYSRSVVFCSQECLDRAKAKNGGLYRDPAHGFPDPKKGEVSP